MASCVFVVVLIFTLRLSEAAQDFTPVSACPPDADSWKSEASKKNCRGDTPDYLCAAIENEPGNLGEICTKYGLTPAKKCAVLNQQTKNLDSVDCKAPSGCPKDPYNPSELWKHKICYRDFYGTTPTIAVTIETTAKPLLDSPLSDEGGSGTGAVVAVIVVLLIICIAVVVLVVLYKRHQGFRQRMQPHIEVVTNLFGRCPPQQENDVEKQPDEEIEEGQKLLKDSKKKKEEGPEYAYVVKKNKRKDVDKKNGENETIHWDEEKKISKLRQLLRYPIHILKQELDVRDLKEKIVIFSKSMKAHFTVPLISSLQSVQSSNDYSRLDMTVVFTLLQNFCENIKPPRKGWGYEPPSEEITTGADIERIRLMWNKFCDGDLQFPQLDDVYNRMKDKYGTEAVLGDDSVQKHGEEEGFEELKEKITSNRLNPDCEVENGIIITDNITSAITLLQTRKVVILRGAIGCGKTSALKAIQNHYKAEGFKVVWDEESEHETWKMFTEKSIVLCDNLFGRFGCHTFSKQDILKIENCLESIENEPNGNTKVVVGIHQHVFEEVKKTCPLNFLLNRNSTVDMDKLSTAEKLLIFKMQQKEGHCKADPECWFGKIEFPSVFTKLSQSPGNVGSPFLSLMYCHHHELFSEDEFTKNPVQSLMKHFQKMRKDSQTNYLCLVYLMVVQSHALDEELQSWAGLIETNVTKDALNNLCKQKFGYIQKESKNARLIHDVLTIVLFKCTAELKEDFLPVVQQSHKTVLLELMRPPDDIHCEFYTSLAKVKKNEDFREVGKVLLHRLAHDWTKNWEHPLQSTAIFKEKSEKYFKKLKSMEKK
uniref:Uncharacterized protein LOC111117454 isoform X2 n=1 Tax=Crassostrea virginica TaxID=6565 RepID=A0A8B8C966_CRAVI|nr:uncharacterized protein LOC111117454 isoform X2 [Crassostrea virginica]